MNKNMDARVLNTREKILIDKVNKIQEKIKLIRKDIEWNVLSSPILSDSNSFMPIILNPDEVGRVSVNPNKVWISASIINFPSLKDNIMVKSDILQPSKDSLADAILQALAFIEAGGKNDICEKNLKEYRALWNADAKIK